MQPTKPATVAKSGYITEDQFIEYYQNVGCFEEDEDFEELMRTLWKTPTPIRPGTVSINRGGGASVKNLGIQNVNKESSSSKIYAKSGIFYSTFCTDFGARLTQNHAPTHSVNHLLSNPYNTNN